MGHASMILSWQEHLPIEDQPPRWMWHLDHEIERHFDELKARREDERYGGDGDTPMMRNALVRR